MADHNAERGNTQQSVLESVAVLRPWPGGGDKRNIKRGARVIVRLASSAKGQGRRNDAARTGIPRLLKGLSIMTSRQGGSAGWFKTTARVKAKGKTRRTAKRCGEELEP